MRGAGRGIAPYVVVLLIVSFLFFQVSRLGFEAPAGRTGPDVWPRMILILAALVCLYEIGRRMLFAGAGEEAPGEADGAVSLEEAAEGGPPPGPTYPWLVAAGIAMSVAYVLLLGTLGFFLCTAAYLAGFMVLGGYRRSGVIAACSLLGSLVFMFVFMKVVYVSLPLGTEPFSQVSFALMRLMHIH